MSTRPDTTITARTERLLGIRQPKPRSLFWFVFSVLLVAWGAVTILQLVLSEGWDEEGFMQLGGLFIGLWLLFDVGGALLYVRRDAAWGRTLRVIGHAVFLPLVIVSYLIGSWFTATWLFFAQARVLLLAALVSGTRAARRVRRNGAARQGG
ncbi:MAG: hypothetical protein M3Q60_21790 [Actinomycetota bacterium]|nr:hypothetical protein [Actinomycetota bacterium]